ncbi:MAG TPA: plastocyanin/azurin family copper-binding protein [Actinomycetota bacterium]
MLRRVIGSVSLVLTVSVAGPAPAAWAGGGGCAELTEGVGGTVEILYSCFTPTLLRVDPGTAVTFVNRDPYRHVLTGAGYRWYEDGWFRPGEAVEVTFDRNGVYPFQCYLHPGMSGAVIVGDGSGRGPAGRTEVAVEPVRLDPPSPEVVVVTPEPEIRTVARTVERPSLLAVLVIGALGLAAGAGLGLAAARRRREPLARS